MFFLFPSAVCGVSLRELSNRKKKKNHNNNNNKKKKNLSLFWVFFLLLLRGFFASFCFVFFFFFVLFLLFVCFCFCVCFCVCFSSLFPSSSPSLQHAFCYLSVILFLNPVYVTEYTSMTRFVMKQSVRGQDEAILVPEEEKSDDIRASEKVLLCVQTKTTKQA